jgi:hypothetical protein
MYARRAVRVAAVLAVAIVAGARPPAGREPCEWDHVERVVAVGDVHGAYDRLLEILQTAGVVDSGGHWSGGAAHLVQLGDLVDRGSDSRRALDFVRRLEREAPAAGGQVHILLGNHEAARMLGDLRLTVPGEYAAFATADSKKRRDLYFKTLKFPSKAERDLALAQTPPGFVEMREAFGRDGEYGRWLRQLPATMTINGTSAHGGISPVVAPMGCRDQRAGAARAHRRFRQDAPRRSKPDGARTVAVVRVSRRSRTRSRRRWTRFSRRCMLVRS